MAGVEGKQASQVVDPPSWVVVVPVKPLPTAKTRLDRPDRADLALAMAVDTVAAAAACPSVRRVLVVTDDERARAAVGAHADVLADEPRRGLNPALEHGARRAAAEHPGAGIVALAADLPALRPDELHRALAEAAGVDRALVADAAGDGTVLLTAAPGLVLDPRFGFGSRAGHRAAGVVDMTERLGPDVGGTVPGLRRDVDTVDDLTVAAQLGLGPATTAATARPGDRTELQATVRTWDPATGAGDAVTDRGETVPLPIGTRLTGSLRGLRRGQRVWVSRPELGMPDVGLVTESPAGADRQPDVHA